MIRLFGYYAVHSVINQIKKLFKSWVLIFIVACVIFGAIIGVGVSLIEDAAESQDVQQEQVWEDEEDEAEYAKDGEDVISLKKEVNGRDLSTVIIELIIGMAILVAFGLQIINADQNGSNIFLPADVNLLFASPLKPQSVLMFRIMMQIGSFLLSSIFLIFQIPTLIERGMSVPAAIALLSTWFFALVIGNLLNVWVYTLTSTHEGWKKYIRIFVFGFVGILLALYGFLLKTQNEGYLETADRLFNASWTRWVPFWGWLKGFAMYAIEGNLRMVVLFGVILLIGMLILSSAIWQMKADFYEDAMAKSEQKAEMLDAVQKENGRGIIRRKKARSKKLQRDGMAHGSGANVFFYKTLYNRFRFAKFGIFTKTAITYFAGSAALALFWIYVVEEKSLMPMLFFLIVFVFLRTLGNPLEEDTSKDFFRMIPERTGSKLFFSLMGGAANTALDLLPAFVLAACFRLAAPWMLCAWLLFLLSVDFYGTNVSTFIDMAVPLSVGKPIKQGLQLIFIYFGSVPVIGIIAAGLILHHLLAAAVISAAINVFVGSLFLVLTAVLIDSGTV